MGLKEYVQTGTCLTKLAECGGNPAQTLTRVVPFDTSRKWVRTCTDSKETVTNQYFHYHYRRLGDKDKSAIQRH